MNHPINSQTYLSRLHNDHSRPSSDIRKTYKKRKREEDRQSGINPEGTEVDFALADIIQRFKEAQKIHQDTSERQEKKNRARRSKSR